MKGEAGHLVATLPTEHETPNLDCIHCGLCLPVCPTYLQLGSEVDSPRGRIYLMKAVDEGRISPSSVTFEKHMFLCLECRACETACPSGVKFSLMMNEARSAIRDTRKPAAWEGLLRNFIFKTMLPSRRLLHVNFRLLRFYQRNGFQKLVRASGMLHLFPRRVREMATVRVLERNESSVCSPSRQTCCGALHLHDGEEAMARELARRNIEAFEKDGADFVIVNAAGCGAMLKEYAHLLEDDPVFAERARAFSRRVKDISEYLDSIGLNQKLGRVDLKVTYDDPCHLLHGQGIKAAPRNLLKSIPGLELVELRDADRCCGSAGIYNLTQPEMAARILDDKIGNLARTGAQVVATGNPGCLLQISQGIRSRNLPMDVAHPVELLDRAYQAYESKQMTGTPEELSTN